MHCRRIIPCLYSGVFENNHNLIYLRAMSSGYVRLPKRIFANEAEFESEGSKRVRKVPKAVSDIHLYETEISHNLDRDEHDDDDTLYSHNTGETTRKSGSLAKQFSESNSYNKLMSKIRRTKRREKETQIHTTDQGVEWRYLPENDTKFLNMMTGMKNRKKREEWGKIFLEGRRLIAEALTAGVKLDSLYFANEEELDKLPLLKDEGKLYKISNVRMETWSDLETPPGIFAIMDKPDQSLIEKRQTKDTIPLTVILDNLRDPGNMGSVIRTLAAVGCQKIVLMRGCCDAWESKVLRGGMGSHFVLPIYEKVHWEHLRNYLPPDFNVYLADSNSYETTEQAESYKIENEEPVENDVSTTTVTYEENEQGEKVIVDTDLKNPKAKYCLVKMPVLEHYKINFVSASHVALIIGGETEGISKAAHHFVYKYHGVKCHISMVNNVNSLNVATAASAIAFEIRRQLKDRISSSLQHQKEECEHLTNFEDDTGGLALQHVTSNTSVQSLS